MVVQDIERDDVEFICKTLGCVPVAHIDHLSADKFGTAALCEQSRLSDDSKIFKITGIENSKTVSLLVRGSNPLVIDEAERSLHDALCVLVQTVKNKQVIYGGGNAEVQMALECEKLAAGVKGKEALAIQSYARALRQLPIAIAENAGFDANELIHDLEIELATKPDSGINVDTGCIDSMEKLSITVIFF